MCILLALINLGIAIDLRSLPIFLVFFSAIRAYPVHVEAVVSQFESQAFRDLDLS